MKLSFLLLLLCLSTRTFAAPTRVHDLMLKCQNAAKPQEEISKLSAAQQSDVSFCEGYVTSMMDMWVLTAANENLKQQGACAPEVPLKDAIKVVVQYLAKHPEISNDAAPRHVATALAQGFRCR